MLPAYLRRMVRRGNYRKHFGQRLGIYSVEERASFSAASSPMWVQAVSVGEMLVALKLVAAMRERRPGLALVLSTTTTTGFQLARERGPQGVRVIYTPIDLRFAVRRAFEVVRPREIVIVDGGLWPNFLLEARRRQVPVTLANARLSPRSERRFRLFLFLARSMFELLDRVCVPEAGDVERWEALGVARKRLINTGSMKYDDRHPGSGSDESSGDPRQAAASDEAKVASLRKVMLRLGVEEGAPVFLGGSTHPGEERLLAEVFVGLRVKFPNLLLLIAPRHVERTKEVLAALVPLGLRIVTRTETLEAVADASSAGETASGQETRRPATPPDVFLLDTTGELHSWYELATVVFIGKSLLAVGGQNPAEAIAAGKPVLFGPHMENFQSLATQLLVVGGAVEVKDAGELQERAADLLADEDKRRAMSDRARGLLLTHRGAARRTAEVLVG